MRRALELARGGGANLADGVTLPRAERYRRRGRLTTDAGEDVLLDLPEATEMNDGDALVLDDGRRLAVRAAAEPLYRVTAGSARALARLAWHVGNRHLPAEIGEDALVIERDHVVADMIRRLGGTVEAIEAPFSPEGGAYGHGRTHAHAHHHDPHADPNAHIPHRHGG
ncbi:MAG: urease accessory protein UreE [Paracoccaceae bacterium]